MVVPEGEPRARVPVASEPHRPPSFRREGLESGARTPPHILPQFSQGIAVTEPGEHTVGEEIWQRNDELLYRYRARRARV